MICFESKSKRIKRFIEGAEWCCIVEKVEDDRLFGKVFQPNLDNSQQSFSAKAVSEIVEMFAQA